MWVNNRCATLVGGRRERVSWRGVGRNGGGASRAASPSLRDERAALTPDAPPPFRQVAFVSESR